ncbi:MAG: response regulator [Cyclobacteriaceae bacterium]|nr:response regulator [Cyclobacteriaceae bacterium]
MNRQNESPSSDQSGLRQKAENQLKAIRSKINSHTSESDIIKVIHELQVHQLELELQNEELLLAKERAELAEKKHTELYEAAPSGYITLSKHGDILELNYSAAKLLNKTRAHLINNRLALFISEDTLPAFNQFIDNIVKSNDKENCEVSLFTEGKSQINVRIDGISGKDGESILLSLVDITKLRQAEESIRQLEIFNESTKFKQSFLANMSHEIRTPLTGILGMIDILRQTHLSEEQKDYFHTLKLSSENLKMIINQVLDYSKIEAGKVKLKPSIFEFNSLFAENKALFMGSIKNGVEFSAQTDMNIPEYIFADKKRISQVINNLISNAIKFTNEGSILIHGQLVSSSDSGKQVMIKIAVTDTGVGIPDEMQKKLFIPFSQIDDKDTRNYEGTGLGLSICKELVSLLDGKIGVDSVYHKGSTFWFTFPAKVFERPLEQDLTPEKHINHLINNETIPNPKLRILFAEDKLVNQKVISLILTSMGHKVTLASNGQQALEIFDPGLFDLILMDIQMPVMDGITATQKLKDKFTNMPPIVGLSANAFEGDREKYMNLGMDEYLTKPVSEGDLTNVISQLRG